MKIGVFGGSFDPIHLGHLLAAEIAREQCKLDQVLFIPAHVAPHKLDRQTAAGAHRLAMVELAIAGNAAFQVTDLELQRGGTSFTVDTLRELTSRQPEVDWYLLMGGDSLDEFDTWKQPEQICHMATPLVVQRRSADPVDLQKFRPFTSDAKLEQIRNSTIDFPVIEISSSQLRHLIATGQSIRYQLPRAVEKYIQSQRLYLSSTESSNA